MSTWFGLLSALAVGLGGAAGAAARYSVDSRLKRKIAPLASLCIINAAGAGVLGLLSGAISTGEVGHGGAGAVGLLAALVGTGLCGGFTTFSTAMVEVIRPLPPGLSASARRRARWERAGWTLLMVLAAVLCYAAGAWLGLTSWR